MILRTINLDWPPFMSPILLHLSLKSTGKKVTSLLMADVREASGTPCPQITVVMATMPGHSCNLLLAGFVLELWPFASCH